LATKGEFKMETFKRAAYVNKETGEHFADRSPLPVTRVRIWTLDDDLKFPKPRTRLPDGAVLVAPVEPHAAHCYYVSREEALRAGLA